MARELGALTPVAKATQATAASSEPPAIKQSPGAGSQQAIAEPAIAPAEPDKPPGPSVALGTSRPAPTAATSTAAPAPALSEGTPFYKKWWFWTAAGVVAGGAGAAIAFGSGSANAPSTHLGTTPDRPQTASASSMVRPAATWVADPRAARAET